MITVKNNGTVRMDFGQSQPIIEVFEGFIKPVFLDKGKIAVEVLYTGKTPGWYPPRVIKEAVPAVEADQENNIPGSPEIPAVIDAHPEKEFTSYGFYSVLNDVDCDHEGNVLLRAHEAVIEYLKEREGAENWEITGLKTV